MTGEGRRLLNRLASALSSPGAAFAGHVPTVRKTGDVR